jgi:putative chitinase
MIITADILRASMPGINDARVAKYLDALNVTLAKYEINTPLRAAHFLAQVGHESASLRYVEEIASGAAYEGRKNLGNVFKGDGVKFKGRGVIQLTGRDNYRAYSEYAGIDFIKTPKLLAEAPHCIDSAGWFWRIRSGNLNPIADKDDVRLITRRINGGTNGYDDRVARLIRAKKALL